MNLRDYRRFQLIAMVSSAQGLTYDTMIEAVVAGDKVLVAKPYETLVTELQALIDGGGLLLRDGTLVVVETPEPEAIASSVDLPPPDEPLPTPAPEPIESEPESDVETLPEKPTDGA